ncbi:MAG: hypothetical protein H8E31_14305, partial [Planctomycetes bacterium]|nr:hypothetical protein [Planctomycetota bacterium]
ATRVAHAAAAGSDLRAGASASDSDQRRCSPGWRVESADILRPRRPDGRCPSDHEPVVAVLSLLR